MFRVLWRRVQGLRERQNTPSASPSPQLYKSKVGQVEVFALKGERLPGYFSERVAYAVAEVELCGVSPTFAEARISQLRLQAVLSCKRLEENTKPRYQLRNFARTESPPRSPYDLCFQQGRRRHD